MEGWSRFKQARLDDALKSFFGVLDAKLGKPGELTRADRELVDDTFRVTSISLAALQGRRASRRSSRVLSASATSTRSTSSWASCT